MFCWRRILLMWQCLAFVHCFFSLLLSLFTSWPESLFCFSPATIANICTLRFLNPSPNFWILFWNLRATLMSINLDQAPIPIHLFSHSLVLIPSTTLGTLRTKTLIPNSEVSLCSVKIPRLVIFGCVGFHSYCHIVAHCFFFPHHMFFQ